MSLIPIRLNRKAIPSWRNLCRHRQLSPVMHHHFTCRHIVRQRTEWDACRYGTYCSTWRSVSRRHVSVRKGASAGREELRRLPAGYGADESVCPHSSQIHLGDTGCQQGLQPHLPVEPERDLFTRSFEHILTQQLPVFQFESLRTDGLLGLY